MTTIKCQMYYKFVLSTNARYVQTEFELSCSTVDDRIYVSWTRSDSSKRSIRTITSYNCRLTVNICEDVEQALYSSSSRSLHKLTGVLETVDRKPGVNSKWTVTNEKCEVILDERESGIDCSEFFSRLNLLLQSTSSQATSSMIPHRDNEPGASQLAWLEHSSSLPVIVDSVDRNNLNKRKLSNNDDITSCLRVNYMCVNWKHNHNNKHI